MFFLGGGERHRCTMNIALKESLVTWEAVGQQWRHIDVGHAHPERLSALGHQLHHQPHQTQIRSLDALDH